MINMRNIKKYFFVFLFVFFLPLIVNAKDKEITLYFFHGDGCPHCAEEEKFLEKIKDEYKSLKIESYEVWYDDDNAELLNKVADVYDTNGNSVPTTVIGNSVFVGYGDTTAYRIKKAIRYYQKEDYIDQVARIKDDTFNEEEFSIISNFKTKKDKANSKQKVDESDYKINVPIFGKVNLEKVSLMSAAVIIGLIDGFNPCAMWILLFLISVLIGMKNRKRMWALGLTFLITSALVYMLIMLSWIQIAVKITTVIWIRNIIAIIALIGGIINLRSYIKSKDSGCEVVDDKKRKTIFKKIRKFTSEKSFILALLGVMGLAISVNLVELACSAGLPLVFTELLAINDTSDSMKFLYTVIYILFFLIDDLIVFFIAMFTMKITGISTKYNKYSHLLGGIIMLAIGILLLIKPEWLMFQFK